MMTLRGVLRVADGHTANRITRHTTGVIGVMMLMGHVATSPRMVARSVTVQSHSTEPAPCNAKPHRQPNDPISPSSSGKLPMTRDTL